MPLVADASSPFAINGFTGDSGVAQLSFWLTFILFNMYVVLEVVSLAAFYFASRPRSGRPNPAAIWYFVAAVLVVFAFITTVWAAPAERAFLDDAGTHIAVGTKAVKLFIGLAAAALAVLSLLIGMVDTARRRRAATREVLVL
ncbi:MAG: hypothetical protein M3R48_04405 [Candidatus Dormibacteraeota bacterium]|nr:hypothetical protein [Candidatus Dormibacteraeota bacterium]